MASTMQSSMRLFQHLKGGQTSWGAWQTMEGANLGRMLAKSGVDWIVVDCEHGNIADSEMHAAVAAIAATSVTPLVRVPAPEGYLIKRALDSGAHGIMVPLLRTAEDAADVVAKSKFPPRGVRGFGSPFARWTFPGVDSDVQYLQQANDSLLTLIQIETKEALENVEAIAAVDGVDVLFVGPFDLGNNIGHPILTDKMDKELEDAIMKIHEAAVKHGKRSGVFCTSGAQAKEYAAKGFTMINLSGDMIAIPMSIGEQLKAAKGS